MLTQEYINRVNGGLVSTVLVGKKVYIRNLTSTYVDNTKLVNKLGVSINEQVNGQDVVPDIYIFCLFFNNELLFNSIESLGNYDGTQCFSDYVPLKIPSTDNVDIVKEAGYYFASVSNGICNDYKNAQIFYILYPAILPPENAGEIPESYPRKNGHNISLIDLNNRIAKIAKAFGVKLIEPKSNAKNDITNAIVKALLYQ